MPALEARLDRLTQSHTQALGISIDSMYVHANFGSSLGGISYPLLADFHPKGAVAESMGVYFADKGLSDRATIIIDSHGIVRHASSTGQRDMDELAATCDQIYSQYSHDLPPSPPKPDRTTNATIYVRNHCGASRAVLLACDNLHLGALAIKNVSENENSRKELKSISGAETAPVMTVNNTTVTDSSQIVSRLVDTYAPLD